jgi:hypothetical protein
MTTRDLIIKVTERVREILLDKNAAYGDSVTNPVRIFSSSDPMEQLRVRIDDKLSRLARGKNTDKVPEDTLMDLIGYLVLLVIAQEQEDEPALVTNGPEAYSLGFTITEVESDAWIALTKSNPQPGDEVTTFPVKIVSSSDHPWPREHL